MKVDVVYAEPEGQTLVTVQLAEGATVEDALRAAIDKQASELTHQQTSILAVWDRAGDALAVGIFGTRCELSDVVQHHDRVEIYRPLQADPKTARRRRAEEQRRVDQ